MWCLHLTAPPQCFASSPGSTGKPSSIPYLICGATRLALSRQSGHSQLGQCPDRLEARSEACSDLSLKPKQDMSLSKLREIVKDREAWPAAVHGVTKSQTQLSDWTAKQDYLFKSLYLRILLLLFSHWVVSDSLWPYGLQHARLPAFTLSWSLLKSMSFESMMLSNHLVLCCPLLPLPSVFPSFRVFSSESDLHIMWPKYWSFSISPSNE